MRKTAFAPSPAPQPDEEILNANTPNTKVYLIGATLFALLSVVVIAAVVEMKNTFAPFLTFLDTKPAPMSGTDDNEPPQITVDEIFLKLEATNVCKVIGFEVISHVGARNSMAVSPAIITALTQRDLKALSRIIAEQTDYECLIGKDYFIIVPKDDPTKHDLATCKREIQIDTINNSSYQDILGQINKRNPIESHRPLLAGPLFANSTVKVGAISLKSGQYKCYDLLNEMAKQLNAPAWRIDHVSAFDLTTYKEAYPEILDPGCVTFDIQY